MSSQDMTFDPAAFAAACEQEGTEPVWRLLYADGLGVQTQIRRLLDLSRWALSLDKYELSRRADLAAYAYGIGFGAARKSVLDALPIPAPAYKDTDNE